MRGAQRTGLGIVLAGLLAGAAVVARGSELESAVAWSPPASGSQVASQQALPLDRVLPIDAAVRTGQFPNGLTYFIRRNTRPAHRVSMRLAVDAGAIQEDDNQRGLAHFIEHMAFNGSENFKPGELVSFLESIGARFGPHVNAQTGFDDTIYMLDVPSDRPGYVDKGLLALHDFAAGISFLPAEIEKERGVVLEEWRGRLGAGSRLTDKQLPVLLQGSRYADRLPIGLPEILRTAPRERLVSFYQKWYRPDAMAVVVVGDIDPAEAETLVMTRLGAVAKPGTPIAQVDRTVPRHDETLYSMATDPEAQSSTVTLAFKRTAEEQKTVSDYRQSLVRQLVDEILNLRLREIARRPNAPFLAAQAGGDSIGRTTETFELSAAVPDGALQAGLEALVLEARRVQQFGFNLDEVDRARSTLVAAYERANKESGTTESPSYANEYVRHFLEREPIPGIAVEYQIATTYLPDVSADEVSKVARGLITDANRVVLGVAPEKAGVTPATVEVLKTAMTRGAALPVERWADATAGKDLVAAPPAGGKVVSSRTLDDLGVTVLALSNGAEVWLKPTDFKNDEVLFSAYALGGTSLAAAADYPSAALATSMVGIGGLGGFSPVDLSKMLAGQIARATPRVGAYTNEISGSATPKDLETALKLSYLTFTAPNFTPDALELLKRRLGAALENQAQNPRAVFAEKVELVNTSNHYSAKDLTVADLPGVKLDVMRKFYADRFANAADFTYFIVGTFSVADVTPLVERWIGGLPSTGTRRGAFRDMGVRFPAAVTTAEVAKGREPASQTVISFFADTGNQEYEMHRLRASASVLGIKLREILREELGGTYGVSVSYENAAPLTGYGSVVVQFGSAPENVDKLVAAVFTEVKRLKSQGPSTDDVNKVKEMERRDLETNARQNSYWLGSLQSVHMFGFDPSSILRRPQRTESLTPEIVHGTFTKYFPLDRYTVVTLRPETK